MTFLSSWNAKLKNVLFFKHNQISSFVWHPKAMRVTSCNENSTASNRNLLVPVNEVCRSLA